MVLEDSDGWQFVYVYVSLSVHQHSSGLSKTEVFRGHAVFTASRWKTQVCARKRSVSVLKSRVRVPWAFFSIRLLEFLWVFSVCMHKFLERESEKCVRQDQGGCLLCPVSLYSSSSISLLWKFIRSYRLNYYVLQEPVMITFSPLLKLRSIHVLPLQYRFQIWESLGVSNISEISRLQKLSIFFFFLYLDCHLNFPVLSGLYLRCFICCHLNILTHQQLT